MIQPEYLKEGDKIAIISTARKISLEELNTSINTFKSWGLEVILAPNLFKEAHQFAGTDDERLSDLQWVLDSKDIKAAICGRGGYGTTRFIDRLDFIEFKKNPKWICGFSDVTALIGSINAVGFQALHSTMPIFFDGKTTSESVESLRKALFGEGLKYFSKPYKLNKLGIAKGEIIGGNLSLLNNIIGTKSDFDWSGKILFIEDLDEYLYHIDRMMVHLDRADKLEKLAGLVVGSMSSMHDNKIPFGKNVEEIIHEHCSKYDFPICFNFPIGHDMENMAVRCGEIAELIVDEKGGMLTFM